MSTHFNEVCEFGAVHGTCRCPSPNKTIRHILCPTPKVHHLFYRKNLTVDAPARTVSHLRPDQTMTALLLIDGQDREVCGISYELDGVLLLAGCLIRDKDGSPGARVVAIISPKAPVMADPPHALRSPDGRVYAFRSYGEATTVPWVAVSRDFEGIHWLAGEDVVGWTIMKIEE